MKLIKQTRLFFKEGKSDKVYEVDLCELSNSKAERYLVNFRYGRRGSNLREGTKTTDPVELERAQKLFDSVVVAKTNKGYLEEGAVAEVVKEAIVANVETVSRDNSDYLNYLLEKLNSESSSQKRARIIWRLGDLADSAALYEITKQRSKQSWQEEHAIAFALGRCQERNAVSTLERLQNSSNCTVARMARASYLHVLPEHMLRDALEQERKSLSSSIGTLVSETHLDAKSLQQQMLSHFAATPHQADAHNQDLIALYRLADYYQHLQQPLLVVLKDIPLKPGYFKAVRHIFKAAEMRLDADVFALLSYRFDTEKQFYSYDYSYAYIPGAGYIDIEKEQKKKQPKTAYSQKGREYLRRRSWRALRRLGEVKNQNYVPMAVAQLLKVSDSDDKGVYKADQYTWDSNTRSWEVTSNYYTPLRAHFALNQILYANSSVYTPSSYGRTWKTQSEQSEQHLTRTERFPELWNEQPEAALELLTKSRSHAVHKFAARLLRDHPQVLANINLEQLIALLGQSYPETNELAFDLCKQRLKALGYDRDLYLALMQTDLPKARVLVVEYLERHSLEWKRDHIFLAEQLFVEHEDIAVWRQEEFAGSFSDYTPSVQTDTLNTLIESSLERNHLSPKQYENIHFFCQAQLEKAAREVSFPQINRLLDCKGEYLQLFGADLLVWNKVAFADIPESLYAKVTGSPYASVRAKGIGLLGKQKDEVLLEQPHSLLNIYKQGEHAERNESAPIIVRLADKSDEFAQLAIHELIGMAFQKEKNAEQHADVIKLFTQDLKAHWDKIDNDLLWRLLHARSKAAQEIGTRILLDEELSKRMPEFSVRQWALLGHHPVQDVRERAYAIYKKYPETVKDYMRDALRILDSDWVDAREFGMQFFRDHYQDDDWTPQLLVFICDNNRDDVQAFGRELLQRFFKQELGEEYLLKLSQHPSNNVQLFASSFLREHAAGKPEVLRELKLYFITVLSQVNKGRVCKDRIFKFLMEEAQKDRSVAELVADIYSRQSVTAVIKDKSTLIESLLRLQQQYPDIQMPLISKARPIWQRRTTMQPESHLGGVQ